jgi:flagellar hook protein FlgE
LTIQYYQVNDLGTNPTPINTPPMNQVAYAWYAFDTTGGAAVSNLTLVGGSGIIEGDQAQPTGGGPGYQRASGGDYWGDLIWFNTDGSLGNMGAVEQATGLQARPHIYLPPIQDDLGPAPVSPIPALGAEITDIVLDFGTPGMLGAPGIATPGRRDGLYADAEGTYQFINGVNTYVPNHTAFVKEQDGYRDGQLLGIQFDKTGTIYGRFSNGVDAAIAQIVMAMPENQEGLSKVGGNYFVTSANSGPMFVGVAGQLGMGTIQGNALEGSNVDLTIELSNMIIAQRGFEVNARVISVTNSTLETVTRLGQ